MTETVELNWPGKNRVLIADGDEGYRWVGCETPEAQRVPMLEVREKLGGAGAIRETNLLIAGDARDGLLALRHDSETVLESAAIRLCYIDPPFNTGRSFEHYDDALPTETWLSMMKDRLSQLEPLLNKRSSVWVHIDDSAVHYARLILDEVFGVEAFVATIVWQKRRTRESRSAISSNHDYIHIYAPAGPTTWKRHRNLLPRKPREYRNRDDDPRGPWVDAPFTAPGYRENQQYEIVTPAGKQLTPPEGRSWYATEEVYESLREDDRLWFPKNGEGSPRIKRFVNELEGLVPFSLWADAAGTNDDAKRHLQSLFPRETVFETPKPEELLRRIIRIATDPGDLVVDLFCGSGSTLTAAHKMSRQWIGVERSESLVKNVLIPRLGAVFDGSDEFGITEEVDWSGGGGAVVADVV